MGLTLNTSNGQITLSSSTAGNYEVIRTVTNTPGSLSTSATDIVTINPADNAAFSYSGSPYDLADASNPTPTVTGLSGGTFSSTRDSFTFNRQGDYIQSSVVTSINSVSLWFKPNSTITTTSSGEVLISFGTTDFRRAVYLGSNFGSINNELITVGDQNANYSYYAQSGGTIDTNWHHLAIVHDGSKYQIYLDGSAITTSGSTPLYSSQQLTIGARGRTGSPPADSYFNGKISNVAIWNSNQSSNISNIYNNGFPQTTYTVTPQQWWKLGGNSTFSSGTWTIPNAVNPGTNDASSTTLPSTALNSLDINSTTGLISLSSSSLGTFPVTYDTTGATGSICPATSTQNVQLVNTNFDYPAKICNATGSPNVTPTNFIQQTGGQFTVTPVLSPGLTIDGTTGVIQPIGANAVTYAITYTIGTNSTTKNVELSTVLAPSTTTNTSTLTFNGTSSYIYAEDSSNLRVNGDMTISAWIKFDSNQTGNYQKIINKRDAGGVNYDFYLNNDTIPKIKFFDGSNANDQSTGTITPGSWTHVAITISSGTTNGSTFFIDGVPSGTGTYTITSDDGPLYIGRYYDSPTYGGWWPGEMDEIAIWDRQLTACDINGIYQASSNGITADLSTVYSSNLKYYNRMGD